MLARSFRTGAVALADPDLDAWPQRTPTVFVDGSPTARRRLEGYGDAARNNGSVEDPSLGGLGNGSADGDFPMADAPCGSDELRPVRKS